MSMISQAKLTAYAHRWLVYSFGLFPAVQLFYAGLTNQLGPDPVRTLENTLGEWALWFLIAGLAITPLQRFAKIRLIKFRRALGLIAFAYVALHFTVYIFLDRQLYWSAIWVDVLKRPYITIGLASFLLLLPLALTSNDWSLRELGTAAWKRLHLLAYIAAPLGALHYILLAKVWHLEPFIYLTIILLLVAMRLVWHPSVQQRDRSKYANRQSTI